MQYTKVPFRWQPLVLNGGAWPNHPLSSQMEKRMAKFFRKWDRTPYMSGQMLAGQDGGADCIRFLAAFVDCMTNTTTDPKSLPIDTMMHTKKGAYKVMKQVLRSYPTMKPQKQPVDLQPGDVLCVGHKGGGPSHVLIVGWRENTLWHAIQGSGVCWTGWSLMEDYMKVYRVYRFSDRNSWGAGWTS